MNSTTPKHRLAVFGIVLSLGLGLVLPASVQAQVIPDHYIAVFRPGVANPAAAATALARAHGLAVGHRYTAALQGFSFAGPPQAAAALARNLRIAYVEPDVVMSAFADAEIIPTGVRRIQAEGAAPDVDPADDQWAGPIDVDVAIIDTGIDVEHPDLNVVGGRHFWVVAVGKPSNRGIHEDENYADDSGHGTHVAGVVGARANGEGVVGVAPGARLWAVKVLNASGNGSASAITAGVDWVAQQLEEDGTTTKIEVANLSLGGTAGPGLSTALHDAIRGLVNLGVVVVAAAGNNSHDVFGADGIFGTADDVVPASFPEAMAISALADSDGDAGGLGPVTSPGYPDDSYALFSNFSTSVVSGNPVTSPGRAIDLILPGVDILSTYPLDLGGPLGIGSGTSMAAPHAAGLAALWIAGNGRAGDASGVYTIRQALVDAAMPQAFPSGLSLLNDPDGNLEPIGWAGAPLPNQPPMADFTYIGAGLTVVFTDQSLDPDGTIASWAWDFGDESSSTEQDPPHTYAAAGPYTVTLTVTDNEGASSPFTADVTVSDTQGSILLDAVAYRTGAACKVDLTWSGATGATVTILRDSQPVATVSNTGTYTDAVGKRLPSGTTFTYQISAENGTSDTAQATF